MLNVTRELEKRIGMEKNYVEKKTIAYYQRVRQECYIIVLNEYWKTATIKIKREAAIRTSPSHELTLSKLRLRTTQNVKAFEFAKENFYQNFRLKNRLFQ